MKRRSMSMADVELVCHYTLTISVTISDLKQSSTYARQWHLAFTLKESSGNRKPASTAPFLMISLDCSFSNEMVSY